MWDKLSAWYYERERRIYEDIKQHELARAEALKGALALEEEIKQATDTAIEAGGKAETFEDKLKLAQERIDAYRSRK